MKTGASGERMTRREREKLRHRREILDAAERVFVSKGFDSATVEEIAREAEFSVGAIYTFFRNKEDLCSQVVTKIAEDFLVAFRKDTAAAQGAMEGISKGVEARLRHAQEHGGFLRLLMESRPAGRVTPEGAIPERCQGLYDTYIEELAALLKEAMNEGVLRRLDPLYAALALEGVMNAFFAYWSRNGISMPLDEQLEAVRKSYLDPLIVAQEGGRR